MHHHYINFLLSSSRRNDAEQQELSSTPSEQLGEESSDLMPIDHSSGDAPPITDNGTKTSGESLADLGRLDRLNVSSDGAPEKFLVVSKPQSLKPSSRHDITLAQRELVGSIIALRWEDDWHLVKVKEVDRARSKSYLEFIATGESIFIDLFSLESPPWLVIKSEKHVSNSEGQTCYVHILFSSSLVIRSFDRLGCRSGTNIQRRRSPPFVIQCI